MPYKSRGFTLVEVIVAITILSMIMLATLTAMRTLGQTREKLEQRAHTIAKMRSVTGFLRRSLEQAQPRAVYQMGTMVGHFFYGDKRELVWAAPMPIPGEQGGLMAIRLFVSEKERQLQLQVKSGVQFWVWDEVPVYVLADEIDSLAVSFRTREDGWLAPWKAGERQQPPSHVRLEIKSAGRFWPPLIVAVQRPAGRR